MLERMNQEMKRRTRVATLFRSFSAGCACRKNEATQVGARRRRSQ
jgi:hypothetical protein